MLWWAELSKTLIRLCADGWGWVPSLLAVWPEVTQHWSLPMLFGGANGRLWEGSGQGVLPRTSAASVLVLTVRQTCPHLCRRPPSSSSRSGSVSVGSLLLPLGPDAHTTLCVPSKGRVCFPQSCQSPAVKSHYPSKCDSLGILLLLPDPQVRKPDVGLRTFTPVGGLLWYKFSPVCESPTQQLWDLILL